jgi:hypothetical protein
MLEVARKELIYLNGKIASWNSGIFGYFSNRSVINTDGLVNDNVVKPIKSKKLKKYIDDNNIRYIVDFEVMINVEKNKFRNSGLQNNDLIYFNEIFRDKTKVKWKSSDLLIWEVMPSK